MPDKVPKILDSGDPVNTLSPYQNFRKADYGVIFLENTSNAAGDTVEIYGSFGDLSTDFLLKTYDNADVGSNGTLVKSFSPVLPYIAAKPTQGSWNVYVDNNWGE